MKSKTRFSPEQLEELFLAVFYGDTDTLKAIRDNDPELYALRTRFPLDEETEIYLPDLTFFNRVVWTDENWSESHMEMVIRNRQKTEEMVRFWEEDGNPIPEPPYRYRKYCDFFYCLPDADEDFEDIGFKINEKPLHYFLERGYSEKDILLHYLGERFYFKAVEELLEEGANSDVHFLDEDDEEPDEETGLDTLLGRMIIELDYLITELFYNLEVYESNQTYDVLDDIGELFGLLVGAAAHTEMVNLLERYLPDEENSKE